MPMTPVSFVSLDTHNVCYTKTLLTTSRAGTGIAGLLGLLSSSLTKIISSRVDNNGTLYIYQPNPTSIRGSTYTNDTLRTNQLDELVCSRTLAIALSIGLEVTQVTNMADLVCRSSVCLSVWVD